MFRRIDTNKDGIQNPGELPLASSFVDVKLPNGTHLARIPTNSTGGFNAVVPFPNQQLSLFGPDGTLLQTFTTAPNGGASLSVPVPPSQSTITGDAWIDANRNGIRDPGEIPYSNQAVTIRFANGTVLTTMMTNSTGGFSVPVASYPSAAFVAVFPDGTTKGFITDSAGNAKVLVPIPPAAAIQGSIWYDANRNGLQETAEKPFAGPYVDLKLSNGSLLARVPINATGSFTHPSSLGYANTTINVVGSDGLVLKSFTTDPSGGAIVPVPLSPGVIQGLVCLDVGVDGVCDPSDPPLANSFVTIRFPNGTVLAEVPTNSTGGYSLLAGPYPSAQFTVEGPSGTPIKPFTTDVSGNGGVNVAVPPTPTSSSTKTTSKNTPTPVAIIDGSVWVDNNGNSIQDPSDPAYVNQQLDIKWPNGSVLASVVTNSSGGFQLPTVPYPGAIFTLSSPNGSLIRNFTTNGQGGATVLVPIPPSKTTTGTASPVPIPSGLIQGVLCLDVAANGVCNPTDPPLANSSVTIRYPNGTILAQVPTNATGGFSWPAGVGPGQQLTIEGPVGQQVLPFVTDAFGNAAINVPVPPGSPTPSTTRSASRATTTTIGAIIQGFVWLGDLNSHLDSRALRLTQHPFVSDANNDSQRGPSEPLLPNYGIVLKFANGTVLQTIPSDPSGNFSFPVPVYSKQRFTIESTAGQTLLTFTTDAQGNAQLALPVSPGLPTVTATQTKTWTTLSTPAPTGTIQGLLCVDSAGNGVCDPSDSPLANSLVTIRWPNGTILAQVLTNSTGGYSLLSLAYPNQPLTVQGPTGVPVQTFTTDAAGNARVDVAVPPGSPTATTRAMTSTSTPFPSAAIQGLLCADSAGNGVCDPTDPVLANSYVTIRWPNGTVLAQVPTNSTGGYSLPLFPFTNQNFTVEGPAGVPIRSFLTDSLGNAVANVPIPPGSPTPTTRSSTTTATVSPMAQIQGLLCTDLAGNGVCDPTDPLLANSFVTIRWPNGTVLAQVPTNLTGGYAFPLVPYPNQNFTVEGPTGVPVQSFRTDPSGSAVVNVVIPPGSPTATTRSTTSSTATQTPSFPVINGTVFIDFNKDGVFSPGVDQPIVNETILLMFSNGSIYATGVTLPDGGFLIPASAPAPNENFTVVLASDPTFAAGTISTDPTGAGSTIVPLPPASISGTTFVDMNSDGALSPGDAPLALEPLLLLFPNGSIYANATTQPNGTFILDPALPFAPNENLTVVRALDPATPLASLATDWLGGARIDIPLPPPTITGQVWLGEMHDFRLGVFRRTDFPSLIDHNLNALFDNATDYPLANRTLELRFANGSVYAVAVTDADGIFSTVPTTLAPDQTLYLVDPLSSAVYGNVTLDSTGAGNVDVPIPPPMASGTVFYDSNGDGIHNAGELPYASKPMLIRLQNGTVLTNLTTDSVGNFNSTLYVVFPGQRFEVVDPSTGIVLGTGTTDPKGNVLALVPLRITGTTSIIAPGTATATATPVPLATIQGLVCADSAGNGVCDPTDPVLPNSFVIIRWPNDTILAQVTTNSTGGYTLPLLRYPNQNFTVEGPAGVPVQFVTTDNTGDAVADVPIPPGSPTPTTRTTTSTSTPSPSAMIQGLLCSDSAGNGVCDPTDPVLANSYVTVRWPNGTVLAQVPTNSTGGYSLPIPAYPSQSFTIEGPTGTPVRSFTTDASGNAVVEVAIQAGSPTPTTPTTRTSTATQTPTPLGLIQGVLCSDLAGDGVCDPTDPPLANSLITIRWPNGTIVGQVATNSSGGYILTVPAYPNQSLTIEGPAGVPLRSFKTDASGNARADVPIPPGAPTATTLTAGTATTTTTPFLSAVVQGSLCSDLAGDGVCDPTDPPLANSLVTIRWPNGTIVAQTPTNSSGGYNLPILPYPNQAFTVEGPSGAPIKSFTTDASGNAVADVAVPPASATSTAPPVLTTFTTYGAVGLAHSAAPVRWLLTCRRPSTAPPGFCSLDDKPKREHHIRDEDIVNGGIHHGSFPIRPLPDNILRGAC